METVVFILMVNHSPPLFLGLFQILWGEVHDKDGIRQWPHIFAPNATSVIIFQANGNCIKITLGGVLSGN